MTKGPFVCFSNLKIHLAIRATWALEIRSADEGIFRLSVSLLCSGSVSETDFIILSASMLCVVYTYVSNARNSKKGSKKKFWLPSNALDFYTYVFIAVASESNFWGTSTRERTPKSLLVERSISEFLYRFQSWNVLAYLFHWIKWYFLDEGDQYLMGKYH